MFSGFSDPWGPVFMRSTVQKCYETIQKIVETILDNIVCANLGLYVSFDLSGNTVCRTFQFFEFGDGAMSRLLPRKGDATFQIIAGGRSSDKQALRGKALDSVSHPARMALSGRDFFVSWSPPGAGRLLLKISDWKFRLTMCHAHCKEAFAA